MGCEARSSGGSGIINPHIERGEWYKWSNNGNMCENDTCAREIGDG